MKNPLFRKESLESTKTRALGSVALYCPPYRWLVITFVIVIVAALIIFCIFGSYTKRETARGVLLPIGGMIKITSPSAGRITHLTVQEGDNLNKDAPVATVSSETLTRYGETREAIARQLEIQQQGLSIQLKNLDTLNTETLRSLKEKERLLVQQSNEIDKIYQQRQQQIQLAEGQLNKIKAMRMNGYASNTQVEQQENISLDSRVRLQDVARQRLDIRQQLSQTRQQLSEQPITYYQQKNTIQQKLSELTQSIVENESHRAVDMQAPAKSSVSAVLVKDGQVVSAGQTLALLLPDDALLQARIMLSSRAIGFIQPGQKVVLRYESYPWQKFGQQYGIVTEISKSALSAQEVSVITGDNQVQEPMYQVSVSLNSQTIGAYGKQLALKPGSSLEADFIIDRRRIYEWVLEPLNALGKMTSH